MGHCILENGDEIYIDMVEGKLDFSVDKKILEERMNKWKPPKPMPKDIWQNMQKWLHLHPLEPYANHSMEQ